jgi:hypothetical protein
MDNRPAADRLEVPFWRHDCYECLWLGGYLAASGNRFDLYGHDHFESIGLIFVVRMSDMTLLEDEKLTFRSDELNCLAKLNRHSERELAAISALERWRALKLYDQAMTKYWQLKNRKG